MKIPVNIFYFLQFHHTFPIFQLCTDAVYEPIVFLQKPYSLRVHAFFGDLQDGQKGCPKNQSRLVLTAVADVATNVAQVYRNGEKSNQERICPREVLKFQPPALSNNCRRDSFADLTTIQNYAVNISLENVSYFEKYATDQISKLLKLDFQFLFSHQNGWTTL